MLLQQIRAEQALKEVGEYLPVKVKHAETPSTIVGDRYFPLLFPRFIFDFGDLPKTTDIIFIGKVTQSRKKFFEDIPAFIIDSSRGRDIETKSKDIWYFDLIGKSRFVLCPDGDFTWTYRFFEAVMVKAIPIIENECNLYKGFKYYRKGDNYEYRQDWIEHNINKMSSMLW